MVVSNGAEIFGRSPLREHVCIVSESSAFRPLRMKKDSSNRMFCSVRLVSELSRPYHLPVWDTSGPVDVPVRVREVSPATPVQFSGKELLTVIVTLDTLLPSHVTPDHMQIGKEMSPHPVPATPQHR
jgi:hypothetical protein